MQNEDITLLIIGAASCRTSSVDATVKSFLIRGRAK